MSASSEFQAGHLKPLAHTAASKFWRERGKRIFDLIVAVTATILFLPLFLLVTICIKLDSSGTVFYQSIRGGRFGRPFRMFKFRTMVSEAEKLGGTDTAADDPRITRAGRFLRRYKLDELPQILNVIRGEMSLVGPRPQALEDVRLYSEREREMLLVRPGITDWASVKFRWEEELLRGSDDVHRIYQESIRPEKVRLALEYVRSYSFLTDCRILIATMRLLLTSPPDRIPPLESPSAIPASHAALAINGGRPVRSKPFAPWPCPEEEEIAAAVAVLRSGKINYWTGAEGVQFEREFASFAGRKHGIAVANGTVALELALRVLGIGPGDEVIVPSRTFIASASSVVMVGAVPVIVDVDRVSQTLTGATITPAISSKTKAILAVHLAGWPCDMDSILTLAREHNIRVIEDCAQAHGAIYKGHSVGSMGDIAAFSFCQDKIMTTGGEGGMVVMDDDKYYELGWSFKDHGKNYFLSQQKHTSTSFRWLHDSFGTNWRMSEMQSAIGRVLLRKIDSQLSARRRNAALLSKYFSEIPGLRVVSPPAHIEHAYYKYYTFLRPEMLREGVDRDRVIAAICAEGVPCSTGTCAEIYLENAFLPDMRPAERLPVARELGETSLMFLVHPSLSEHDMSDTCKAVAKVLAAATHCSATQTAA